MKTNNAVRILAGSLVLLSIALGHYVNAGWLWLGVFVGANLFQYGFTNWCLAATLLRKLGTQD